jgi:ADP-heptose:LPS heptosyltransferase
MTSVFLGYNALGDTLCTTPVLRAFRALHPEHFIIYVVQNAPYCRVLDGNPEVDLVIYSEWLNQHGLTPFNQDWFDRLPLDLSETAMLYRFDIQQVCSSIEAFHSHISEGFSRLLRTPITSTSPVLAQSKLERRTARRFWRGPCVIFSMHSNANPSRTNGVGGAKEWPAERWQELADRLRKDLALEIIAVGAEHDPRPALRDVRCLYGLPIKVIAALLDQAACVVTLENGLAHLAAAVDAAMVELYSTLVPLAWAFPSEMTALEVIYRDPLEVPVDEVLYAIKDVIQRKRLAR